MAASILVYHSHGATITTTQGSAEGGVKFNKSDDELTTSPLLVPVATGTNYSYYKSMYLYCNSATGAGTTISNRTIQLAGAPATGLAVVYKDVAGTYTQATAALAADVSGGSPPATPATYTAMTTSPVTYQAGAVTSANATRVGDILQIGVALGSNYTAGGGSAQPVPSMTWGYDES